MPYTPRASSLPVFMPFSTGPPSREQEGDVPALMPPAIGVSALLISVSNLPEASPAEAVAPCPRDRTSRACR